ncbi:MFS transporter [Bacillus spongiae]|uniref:MFS transporter n=1 Tax=Bacillus spongiae TaxID=2683610 RepID=A0ABU8HDG6_9BACI
MGRSYYGLLISQTTTNLGFSLYTMSVVLFLYHATGSTTLSAGVTLISVISRMASSTLLPTFSDRYQLRSLLLFSQVLQWFFLLLLCFLFSIDISKMTIVLTYVVIAIISFFNGWFSPLKSTLVRSIVPEHERVKANSLLSTIDQTFLFGGWTFGGLFLSFFGAAVTVGMSVFLVLLSFLCLLTVKVQKKSTLSSNESFKARLTNGWKFLYRHKGLRVIVTMDLMEAWVGTIWIGAVTLAFVNEALQLGETWWGYINGAYYLGTIIGGVVVYHFSTKLRGRLTPFMLAGASIFGVLTLLYGLVSNPYMALLLVLLMGPAYQLRDLAQETMFQNSADQETLTKIFAARSVLVQFIFILSIIGIGVVVDLIGARLVYILAGGLLISSSIYGFMNLMVKKNGMSLERDLS